jgi:hypothetical protein
MDSLVGGYALPGAIEILFFDWIMQLCMLNMMIYLSSPGISKTFIKDVKRINPAFCF